MNYALGCQDEMILVVCEVSVADVAARPTVVVAATTMWQEFPTLWKELLNVDRALLPPVVAAAQRRSVSSS